MLKLGLLTLLILCTGCDGTNINDKNIQDIILDVAADLESNGMGPGEIRYVNFDVKVLDKDGKVQVIKDPKREQISVTSTPKGLSYYPASNALIASFSNLSYWKTGFDVTVTVPGNPFPGTSLHVPANMNRAEGLSIHGNYHSGLKVHTMRAQTDSGEWMRLFKIVYTSSPEQVSYMILPLNQKFYFDASGSRASYGFGIKYFESCDSNGDNCSSTCDSHLYSSDEGPGGKIAIFAEAGDHLGGLEFMSVGENVSGRPNTDRSCGPGHYTDDPEGTITKDLLTREQILSEFEGQDLSGLVI